MKQNDKGIFLHRINYSESSLIVTFYTLSNGIQKFIFQGGKKKSNALFPLSLCELTFYLRPDSELGKLTEAQPFELLQNIRANPSKSTLAFFMIDVIRQCLKTNQSDPEMFQFLERSITKLDLESDHSLFASSFLLEFAIQLGIDPHIHEENKKFFYLQEGEFSDLAKVGEIVESGEGVLLIQRLVRSEPVDSFSKQAKSEAFDTLIHYYKLHIPRFDVQQSLEVIKEILYS